jgi:hypothetical protein
LKYLALYEILYIFLAIQPEKGFSSFIEKNLDIAAIYGKKALS